MRKSKILNIPTGYPYVLYKINNKFAIACNEVQAKTLARSKGKPIPANIKELVDKLGHAEANKLLKQFGNQWLCKEGKVFYSSL